MNSSVRTALLPALAAVLLVGTSACAAPAAASHPGDPASLAAVGDAVSAASASGTPSSLVVAAAMPGPQQTVIATPAAGGPTPTTAPARHAVQLASYNAATGAAVLTSTTPATAAPSAAGSPSALQAEPSATPSKSPSASKSPAAPQPSATVDQVKPDQVKPGQLIVSPPTPAAPQGVLLAVTAVQPGAGGTVNASTRPATLTELLGGTNADGKVAVDPHAITVKPLVKDLKLSFVKAPGQASADASATLQLDVNAPIPLPNGASAAASGSLQLHPAVHFAYHGSRAGSPSGASIGFDLGAHAEWQVSGELDRSEPIRVPLAELHASPVLMVGGLPVVVNLGLTCFLEVGADGKVSVQAEQDYTFNSTVHADYTGGKGWSPVTDTNDTKVSPLKLQLSGKASLRTGLGAEVTVGLYDVVGVSVTLEPYLRAQADGTVQLSLPSGTVRSSGSLGLYGGVDLTGALLAHLAVFGTPIVEGRIPFPIYHHEWPITTTGSR